MTRHALLTAALALVAASAANADLTKVERRIAKEPKYASTTPRYALLVLGSEARDRVWLVKDGDTLYVDRNGNGDLTETGEKVAAKKGGSADDGLSFEVGDLTLGGRTHRRLNVHIQPLRRYLFDEYARRPDMQAAIKADPKAELMQLSLEMEEPKLREKGLVTVIAGPIDLNGPLTLAAKPADAPVIHCGGPLTITFFTKRPTLRRNRPTECIVVVGTPGRGAGTFAMLGYDGVIPAAKHPTAEIAFPPPKEGLPPVKKRFEFKERC